MDYFALSVPVRVRNDSIYIKFVSECVRCRILEQRESYRIMERLIDQLQARMIVEDVEVIDYMCDLVTEVSLDAKAISAAAKTFLAERVEAA